jgi:hypothetical protein
MATISIHPLKTNIEVRILTLGWLPLWQSPEGQLKPAWE